MANFLKSLFVKGVEIDTTGASSGNVLSYNGTKFAPTAPGAGSLALNDLSDAVVSSPEEFQGISYDGTSWVNGYIPLVSYVRNAESTTITTGTCVYLYGSTGDHATVKRADNTSDTTSSKTIGVVGASITASNNGPVITRGYVDGIDLSTGYTAGDVLWLGTNGAFTKTKPTAPNHLVFIGVVVRATNNGIIYVATQNGYELEELHDVSLPSPNSGEFLKYNGSLWVADAIDLGTDTTGNYMSDISGTSPVSVYHTPAEGSSATVSLASGYGDTQNPYGTKTANYVLAGPTSGSAEAPTFRAIVATDIPTLNQNTTGSAAKWTTARTITLGGDLTGSVSIDGSADATLTATVAANSVALGTDTTGNYMSGTSASTGILVSHTPGEGSTATISVDTAYSGFAPIGSVQMYAGDTAPSGWAICNGAELAIATYGALYSVIGTRYGALTNGSGSAGSTHFKLPSFSARVPKGITTGTPTVPTTSTTNAAASVDVHTHGINSTFTAGSVNSTFTAGNAANHTHSLSGNVGTEDGLHYHFWSAAGVTTGTESAGHSHSYYKPNSGANNNTGGVSANHTHAWSLSGQGTGPNRDSTNTNDRYHFHSVATGNVSMGNPNATGINSSFTAGNVNSSFTAGTASTINTSTAAHTHTTDAVDIVFIIRVS